MTEVINKHYPIKVYYSQEDDCYIAVAPDLAGCKAHGETLEEAAREIQTVIDLWIEDALENNKEIPEPSKEI